jgi:acyl carrier protein
VTTATAKHLDPATLLDMTRQALAASWEGLDVSAVQPETPLAALLFDSLMAVSFIATLEAALGVGDLPFERWLSEHSERADVLTIGSLVEWLRSLPEVDGVGNVAAGRAGDRASERG